MVSLAIVGHDGSRVAHLLRLRLVLQPIWRWSDLGFFQILQSNSSPEDV
jgi:hypothetical protein